MNQAYSMHPCWVWLDELLVRINANEANISTQTSHPMFLPQISQTDGVAKHSADQKQARNQKRYDCTEESLNRLFLVFS